MVDYMTELEVVWHGGMANDPLGGHSKGCLLDPRTQGEDERTRMQRIYGHDGKDDLSSAELEVAVLKLNRSLKDPVVFGRGLQSGAKDKAAAAPIPDALSTIDPLTYHRDVFNQNASGYRKRALEGAL